MPIMLWYREPVTPHPANGIDITQPFRISDRKQKECAMRATPRVMTSLYVLLGIPGLAACSLAPEVAYDALSYHETADVTANRIILLNVLRARDNAPLHFGELSLQHGQVSEQAGVILTEPIGQVPKSSSLPRANLQPSASMGDQVSFDLGTLDTQNFTQGVTAPIAPKMLKYFLDSGIDHRLVLMLLLSGARLPGGHEVILNFPRSERVVCYPGGLPALGTMPYRYELRGLSENVSDCPGREREFVAFLRILNGLRRIYAVSYRPFIPVGQPFRPDVARSLHDLLALDPARQQFRPLPDGRLQFGLLAPEDKIVLCEEGPATSAGGGAAASRGAMAMNAEATPGGVCGAESASVLGTDSGQASAVLTVPDFTVRSTLGIFSFLGQVLGSQENRSGSGKEVCIRLDNPGNSQPDCVSGQVLFHLTQDRLAARFGVEYGGRFWGVPDAAPCITTTKYCDHTLETLSMLSLLLNLNKSARDIPSTPSVQLVP
ncbi:MAG: hypothetical protein ACHQIO_07825 [Nevskiales bacterium]